MTRERKLMRLIAVIFAAVAVAGPAISFAQKSPGGVTGGARQHPGTWSNQRASRSVRHAGITRGTFTAIRATRDGLTQRSRSQIRRSWAEISQKQSEKSPLLVRKQEMMLRHSLR